MKKHISLLLGLSLCLMAICTIPALPARAADTTGTEAVTMFRLYNPNSGEHFYTKDESEKAGLVEKGWKDEGIGWIAPAASNTPVYRLYNPNSGEHHYTLQASERDFLIGVGWNYESIGWYSDDEKVVPIYREYNPNAVTGTHNYTTDKAEHDGLVAAGWHDEGIGWYAIGDGKNDPPKKPDDDSLEIGDIVTFGTYEQDNNLENGPEPIEWQYVADKDGHKYLLSKYALDCKQYNVTNDNVTWETCTLRKWLNEDFYNTAFSDTNKKRIVAAHNENPYSYMLWDTNREAGKGNDTDDNVFLMSWTEAEEYFDGKLDQSGREEYNPINYNPALICRPTAYAVAQRAFPYPNSEPYFIVYPSDVKGCCSWWLRFSGDPLLVESWGSINEIDMRADFIDVAIRPAILID